MLDTDKERINELEERFKESTPIATEEPHTQKNR